MSGRFGRSQRRKAREAVAKAEQAMWAARTSELAATVKATRAQHQLEQVYEEIERIATKTQALLPVEVMKGGVHPDAAEIAVHMPALPSRFDYDREAFMVEPIHYTTTILKRLRIDAIRDELKRGLIAQVAVEGRGKTQVFLSDSAWEYSTTRDFMIGEVAKRLVESLYRARDGAKKS